MNIYLGLKFHKTLLVRENNNKNVKPRTRSLEKKASLWLGAPRSQKNGLFGHPPHSSGSLSLRGQVLKKSSRSDSELLLPKTLAHLSYRLTAPAPCVKLLKGCNQRFFAVFRSSICHVNTPEERILIVSLNHDPLEIAPGSKSKIFQYPCSVTSSLFML